MDQIIKVAWELNENSENRYKLVYEVAELAKKLVDEAQMKKVRDEFGFEEVSADSSYDSNGSPIGNTSRSLKGT